jgi:Domain of unknown function (DUF1906)
VPKRMAVLSVALFALFGLVGVAAPVGAATPAVASAAPAAGAPFIEYTRLPPGSWTTVGLTPTSPPPTLSGELIRFTDPVTKLPNVYVAGSLGHLIEYTLLPTGNWISVDLTVSYRAPAVAGTPQPFVDPLTGFQNVYARTTSGDLIAYTRLPAGNWIAADFSTIWGLPKIAGDAEPFRDPLTGFQNVYGTTAAGHVVEYTRLPPGNWVAVDLTSRYNGPTAVGETIPFTDPLTHFQNAYVRTGSGDLAAYTRLPNGSWISADFTARYGLPQIFSDPQPLVDPATGYQSVYVRATPANVAATLWGVDSCAVANQTALSTVQGQYGTPDFWARYLPQSGGSGPGFCATIATEVAFLHANGIKMLIVDNNGTGDESGTYAAGQASASAAVASALSLGVPRGVVIYHDIEAGDPVSATWIQGWFDQLTNSSPYVPGVYANPIPTSSAFDGAYCAAIQTEAAIASHMAMWSSEPEFAFTTKAGAFPYGPTVPPCGANTPAWQYVEVGTSSNIVDEDLVQVPAAGLW